jgi:hypothetical protein
MVELLLEGRFTGSPDGVINEEVSMKNINSRKIMSVIEDILNPESTLNLDFKLILSRFL